MTLNAKRQVQRCGTSLHLKGTGTNGIASSSLIREVLLMISHETEGACAFAWRNYLLLHSGISENDSRRSALYRYVTNLGDAGEYDFVT